MPLALKSRLLLVAPLSLHPPSVLGVTILRTLPTHSATLSQLASVLSTPTTRSILVVAHNVRNSVTLVPQQASVMAVESVTVTTHAHAITHIGPMIATATDVPLVSTNQLMLHPITIALAVVHVTVMAAAPVNTALSQEQ